MRGSVSHAFTLLELLLVVALLGVLAVFALPDFHVIARGQQLSESAERLHALISMCRAEAMNETVRFRIQIPPDGSVRVLRQAHPLHAPHLYITPRVAWARAAFLLEDVWIEAIQLLPEGPPPIRIVNERLEFPETEIEPRPVEEIGVPVEIDFEPDGTMSNSLRCVLRDSRGFGLLLTLDGRLGSVMIEDWPPVPPDQLQRPEPWPVPEEPDYRPEDYE
jgi:prepilin-type N-terminal cleavage/methylation domain-containing protein